MKIVSALALLAAVGAADAGIAAALSPEDLAWIDNCVADRAANDFEPKALRAYCVCMQEIVEDNRPFASITELERTYPPAHVMCSEKAGLP
jgi:hypothetical protein